MDAFLAGLGQFILAFVFLLVVGTVYTYCLNTALAEISKVNRKIRRGRD